MKRWEEALLRGKKKACLDAVLLSTHPIFRRSAEEYKNESRLFCFQLKVNLWEYCACYFWGSEDILSFSWTKNSTWAR